MAILLNFFRPIIVNCMTNIKLPSQVLEAYVLERAAWAPSKARLHYHVQVTILSPRIVRYHFITFF